MSDLAAQYPEARPLINDGTAHRAQGTPGLALQLETERKHPRLAPGCAVN